MSCTNCDKIATSKEELEKWIHLSEGGIPVDICSIKCLVRYNKIKQLEKEIQMEKEFIENDNSQPRLSALRLSKLHYELGKIQQEKGGFK